jgi:PKD repeat protein
VYINGGGCTTTGPGTQAEPFCTIQEAANVVQAGQTVEVQGDDSGNVAGTLTISSKGTQAEPISFIYEQGALAYLGQEQTGRAAVTFDGAQYVTFSGFYVQPFGSDDGVDVIGSSHITLDNLSITTQMLSAYPLALAGVSISGGSSDVTISRTQIGGQAENGVLAQAGTSGLVATTDRVEETGGSGITLDGATDSVVTSDTVEAQCSGTTGGGSGITVADASSAAVENNVVDAVGRATCPATAAGLSVDAASAAGTSTGYNAFFAPASVDSADYSWDGVSYPTAQAFQQAVPGQGTNDIDLTRVVNGIPPEGSAVIDSANCSAPDELSTDILGNPRVPDPLSTDAGLASGTCHADRGAYELQDTLSALTDTTTLSLSPTGYLAGTAPLTFGVTIPAAVTSSWGEAITYTVNFGDGSPADTATVGAATTHTYTSAGQYTVTISATDTSGSAERTTFGVSALIASPPAITLTAAPQVLAGDLVPDSATFTYSASSLGWEVASSSIAYGATGGAAKTTTSPGVSWIYVYAKPGTYTATVTVKDRLGRTSTAKATITVGDELMTTYPKVDYAHTVAAHGTVKLSLDGLDSDCCSRAALVNVSVTSPKKSGSIVVYPDKASRPDLATVQFRAGQAVENSALALPQDDNMVDFYNTSDGTVNLEVTTYGLEHDLTRDDYGAIAESYFPVTQAQVLPQTEFAPEHQTVVNVVGLNHVPADAYDVVLDITESGSAATGDFATYSEREGVQTESTGGYWAKGQQVTGLVTVPVDAGRAILVNQSKGNAYFRADVVGYYLYLASPAGAVFLPATPNRLLKVTVAGKHWVKVAVAGKDGVPAASTSGAATAALVTLTAASAATNASFTAWADGTSRPGGVISLSYTKGQTTATAAIVQVGKDGDIDLYNGGSKPVLAVLDLDGSFYAY